MATGVGIEQGSGVAPSDDAAALSGSALSQQAVSAVPATGANAFTPGPWSLSGMSERGLYGNNGELAVVAADDRICNVDCHASFKRGLGHVAKCAERDANARLIAAAPELLEAVQAYLAWGTASPAEFEGAFPKFAAPDGTGGVAAINAFARALLAKALSHD